jgi:hypothetical protein
MHRRFGNKPPRSHYTRGTAHASGWPQGHGAAPTETRPVWTPAPAPSTRALRHLQAPDVHGGIPRKTERSRIPLGRREFGRLGSGPRPLWRLTAPRGAPRPAPRAPAAPPPASVAAQSDHRAQSLGFFGLRGSGRGRGGARRPDASASLAERSAVTHRQHGLDTRYTVHTSHSHQAHCALRIVLACATYLRLRLRLRLRIAHCALHIALHCSCKRR